MSGNNKFSKYLIAFAFLIFLLKPNLYSQETEIFEKDSDFDGLTDTSEINVYKTNPEKPDSDEDGVIDPQEILDATNPNDPNSSKLAALEEEKSKIVDQYSPIMWYIGRVSGISAFIMFTLVVCMGLLMTSKILLKFRFLGPANALESHSFNATFIGLTLVVIHFVSFIFDDLIEFSLAEVLVPFLAKRDITTSAGVNISLPIALGIIAFYLALILVVTSQFRKYFSSTKIWRAIHYLSFLFYVLFVVHGFFAGSDSNEWWMRGIYISSVTIVTLLIILRIFGKKYFMPKARVPATFPGKTEPKKENNHSL